MNEVETEKAPRTSQVETQYYPFAFTGSGGEYFRIWIVNLLLTIVTLGVYSAWAKVRKMQYFYRNTRLDGSVFEYHGKPGAILKGRLIALALILFYNFAFEFSMVLGVLAAVAFALTMPWLITQAQRFKLYNTSYRGLRFRFDGSARELYAIFGLPLLFLLAAGAILGASAEQKQVPWMALTLVGILYLALFCFWPYLHFRFKLFQHNGARYGQAKGSMRGNARGFYRIYGGAALMMLVAVLVAAAVIFVFMRNSASSGGDVKLFMAAGVVGMFIIYGAGLVVGPYMMARTQNYVWNHTLLRLIGFDSRVRVRRLAFIMITNLLLIVLTLGLYTPFAAVRMYRYRVESVTVMSTADLAGYIALQSQEVNAVGEGASDLLDLDFAL